MGHTIKVDRLLIRTAAGQAGIGNNDGHITRSAPAAHSRGKSEKGSRRRHRHQPSPIPTTGSEMAAYPATKNVASAPARSSASEGSMTTARLVR